MNLRILGRATGLLLASLGATGLLRAAPSASPPYPARVDVTELRHAAARAGLRPEVLRLALRARDRVVASGLATRPVLTVIDYSLPSRERRLWVLDLAHARVLAHDLVAHGRRTGDDRARSFSNQWTSCFAPLQERTTPCWTLKSSRSASSTRFWLATRAGLPWHLPPGAYWRA